MTRTAAYSLASRRLGGGPEDPRLVWRRIGRPEQQLPPGFDWRVTYWQGGRGSGKTASGAGGLAEWVLSDTDNDEAEYGIVGPTYRDAWTKCVEGRAGILRALGTSMSEVKDHRSRTVKSALRTYGEVVLHNGVTIYIDSAAEGALRVQGRNLKGCWCDEIGLWEKWETAWKESIKYAVRLGRAQILCTATPKASRPARRLIRSLIRNDPEEGGVIIRKLRTKDNAANLSEAFLRAVIGAAQGTRLELQELEGELLDDVANALWTRDLLESVQHPGVGEPGGPPYLTQVHIGVDPSDGSEQSDEQAYTIVGRGQADDPHLYVAENWGGQEAPAQFAKRCIRLAIKWDATLLIEKNHGGRWLEETFRQVMKAMGVTCRYRVVHASLAKRTRAEPISALYERGGGQMVRHCRYHRTDRDGHPYIDAMTELEDQMATFTGAQGERSPDRLDSLVWAMDPFKNATMGPPVPGGARRWALSAELGEWDEAAPRRALQRLTGMHGGVYDDQRAWDLDSFAPRDDDEQLAPPRQAQHEWGPMPDGTAGPSHGPRGNIRQWH